MPSEFETDIDCGAGCPPCGVGGVCRDDGDCASQSCVGLTCQLPSCEDNKRNASETDIDCGGQCDACLPGRDCKAAEDCAEGVCTSDFCQLPTCGDLVKNGNETGVDCGGACDPCAIGMGCVENTDCVTEHCAEAICVAPGCTDGILNGGETGLDCGGHECGPCRAGEGCAVAEDCMSQICEALECTAFSCSDGVLNGEESAADCGGRYCEGCGELVRCRDGSDCASEVCLSGLCVPNAPTGVALSRTGWSATASDSYVDDNPNEVLDSVGGRWTSGKGQYIGMWLEVDMAELRTFFSVDLNCAEQPADNPVKFDVYLKKDEDGQYGTPAMSGVYGGNAAGGTHSVAAFDTAQLARFVKIVLTADSTTNPKKWWSINEFNVLK